MRMSTLIAAMLAVTGCADDSGSRPNNFEDPFMLDEDLRESTIQRATQKPSWAIYRAKGRVIPTFAEVVVAPSVTSISLY